MNNGAYLDVGEFFSDLIWVVTWLDSKFTIRIGNFEFGLIELAIISAVVSLISYMLWGRDSQDDL